MGKLIMTYKTALYMSKEATKLPKHSPERKAHNRKMTWYNNSILKSIEGGDPTMDYLILSDN